MKIERPVRRFVEYRRPPFSPFVLLEKPNPADPSASLALFARTMSLSRRAFLTAAAMTAVGRFHGNVRAKFVSQARLAELPGNSRKAPTELRATKEAPPRAVFYYVSRAPRPCRVPEATLHARATRTLRVSAYSQVENGKTNFFLQALARARPGNGYVRAAPGVSPSRRRHSATTTRDISHLVSIPRGSNRAPSRVAAVLRAFTRANGRRTGTAACVFAQRVLAHGIILLGFMSRIEKHRNSSILLSLRSFGSEHARNIFLEAYSLAGLMQFPTLSRAALQFNSNIRHRHREEKYNCELASHLPSCSPSVLQSLTLTRPSFKLRLQGEKRRSLFLAFLPSRIARSLSKGEDADLSEIRYYRSSARKFASAMITDRREGIGRRRVVGKERVRAGVGS